MNPIAALIASTGLTASRVFLPAFLAALFLRLGASYHALTAAGNAMLGGAAPSWFTSDWCLIVLGALSVLEVAAQRSHDARAIMSEIDHYAKPAMAAVMALGVLSATDATFIQKTVPATGGQSPSASLLSNPLPVEASLFAPIIAVMAAGGTWFLASARNTAQRFLHDADPDNATGVHSLLAWAEDAYVLLGVVLLVLFPVLAMLAIGACIGMLILLQRWAHAREEADKVPCPTCQTAVYRTALACPSCRAELQGTLAVGFLGTPTKTPADRVEQPFDLLAKHRCPSCATRLEQQHPHTTCPACQTEAFASPAFVSAYDARVSARLVPTLLACAGLGLIPLLGLVLGVLLYRTQLVSPYRAHIPRHRSLMIRWLLRFALFLCAIFHLVPVVGAVTVPLMGLLNYLAYRGQFLALANERREESARLAPPLRATPELAGT